MRKTKGELIFNGVDLTPFFIVTNIEEVLVGDIDNRSRQIPGRNGEIFKTSQLGSKIVDVTVRIVEYDPIQSMNIKDEINRVLITKEPQKLELPTEPTKYQLAKLNGKIDFERLFSGAEIVLSFKNFLGISFNKALSTGTTNNGNTSTPFTLEGNISGDLVTILNRDTLDKIAIDATEYTDGTPLRYESEWEHLFINNNLDMKNLYVNSDNFWLSPGQNNIEVTGLTSYTFKNRARWL